MCHFAEIQTAKHGTARNKADHPRAGGTHLGQHRLGPAGATTCGKGEKCEKSTGKGGKGQCGGQRAAAKDGAVVRRQHLGLRQPQLLHFSRGPLGLQAGLRERFPNAVLNVIVTAIGGEDSVRGYGYRELAPTDATGATIVASGNIGCLTQLAGDALALVHSAELLDWASGGPRPAALAAYSNICGTSRPSGPITMA